MYYPLNQIPYHAANNVAVNGDQSNVYQNTIHANQVSNQQPMCFENNVAQGTNVNENGAGGKENENNERENNNQNYENDCFNNQISSRMGSHFTETKFYLLLFAFLINFEVIVFITYWIYENDEVFNRYYLLFFYVPFLIQYTFPNFKKLVLVSFVVVMALKIKMCSVLDNDTFTMILFFTFLAETIVYFVLTIS